MVWRQEAVVCRESLIPGSGVREKEESFSQRLMSRASY